MSRWGRRATAFVSSIALASHAASIVLILGRHEIRSIVAPSMSGGDRIPLWVSGEPPRVGRQDTVLVVTGDTEPPTGYAAIRHAEAAAIAQHGGCACCRVPSDLVTLLRQLF